MRKNRQEYTGYILNCDAADDIMLIAKSVIKLNSKLELQKTLKTKCYKQNKSLTHEKQFQK